MWKCPKCSSTNLNVMITTCAKLLQYEDNFETEVDGNHEWGNTSNMTCEECGHCDAAASFETEEDEEPEAAPPATAVKKEGQLWEGCERCGREPCYMPLHLCDRCWPN